MKDRKKRIVVVTNIPSPYRVALYEFFQRKYTNYEFYIIFSAKEVKSELRQWKTTTDNLQNAFFLPNYVFTFRKRYDERQIIITYGIKKLLSQIAPNVVICAEYNLTSLQAMRWCVHHKIPYISLTDGTLFSERNIGKLQKLARKYIMHNSYSFIASSTKAKEKIEYYSVSQPIYVSCLTVDISKYQVYKNKCGNKRLIYVGSLIERKGVDLLFYAIAQMKNNCQLQIVGAGHLENELKSLAHRLGIGGRIHFLGYKQREELVELYKDADVFVLPTREDCYGLVILEAMCASLPVVCSKYADGAYDLIDDGVTGYIVDPYNAAEFASKLDEALNLNRDNKMGIAAYKRSHDFSFSSVGREFMRAVEDAV